MPIKKRIEKLERLLNARTSYIKAWDVKSENREKLIADIIAGKVKNRVRRYFPEKDSNYLIDFNKFVPDCLRNSEQKFDYSDGKENDEQS